MATFVAAREAGESGMLAPLAGPAREGVREELERAQQSGLLRAWWRGWVAWASSVGRGGLR